jgi:NAD(P)-dependent dehydrogenase (short-subunit alcohol dehydrogenase family)
MLATAEPSAHLVGQTALITAGSRGIGATISRTLAVAGADIAINFLQDEASAGRLAEEIAAESGRRAVTIKGDVSDPREARRAVDEASDRLGSLAILINNAGPFLLEPLLETSADDFLRIFAGNLFSTHSCSVAAIPHMKRLGRGAIVNVGLSATSEIARGAVNVGAYAISKLAVASYTRTLAAELAHDGIVVTCVAPGLIDNGHLPAFQREWMERRCPAGRLGQPEDVAQVVAFLASETARYLGGAVIAVAGGWDWAVDRSPFSDGPEVIGLFRQGESQ